MKHLREAAVAHEGASAQAAPGRAAIHEVRPPGIERFHFFPEAIAEVVNVDRTLQMTHCEFLRRAHINHHCIGRIGDCLKERLRFEVVELLLEQLPARHFAVVVLHGIEYGFMQM